MKVNVDKDRCFGCGGCVASVDNVFEFDDDGKANVKDVSFDSLDSDSVQNIKDFIDNDYCPGGALSYEE